MLAANYKWIFEVCITNYTSVATLAGTFGAFGGLFIQ